MLMLRLVFSSLLAGLLAGAPAVAQQPAPAGGSPSEAAAQRYPQPVRVGDLIRRQVLRPVEQQNVLGRVAGVVRRENGAVLIVVETGGVLGFNTRPVAVPVEAVALLGEYVALVGLTPGQLGALPLFDPAGTAPVPPDETIRVGLVRPFH
jgi:hypothetical protein